ncbi:hypothetical protein AA0614_2201 [Komagataeibacter saccharivorans NRIC 0614]|nr:hypothetical protein AA0614_2201 [Komagataeibacter saccharivorans NRIC 0614]
MVAEDDTTVVIEDYDAIHGLLKGGKQDVGGQGWGRAHLHYRPSSLAFIIRPHRRNDRDREYGRHPARMDTRRPLPPFIWEGSRVRSIAARPAMAAWGMIGAVCGGNGPVFSMGALQSDKKFIKGT